MTTLENLLVQMWNSYCDLNPEARRVYDLLTQRKEQVLNDHIALRTFRAPGLGLPSIANVFLQMGYVEKLDYEFKEKKLYAKHYEHPDEHLPKIFISELLLEQLSAPAQKILQELLQQMGPTGEIAPEFLISGRPWQISHADYLTLAQESEYASWVAAHGFRPNHFTVNFNALKTFDSLQSLNQFLTDNGFRLNASGGLIKGSPAELLEQSSTMAQPVPVNFTDGQFAVPGCYYEFARRYALPSGKLYTGFIAASADKIFESTNRL